MLNCLQYPVKIACVLITLLWFTLSPTANAQGVQTVQQLLQTAVTSGQSKGQITGDIAALFQQQFKTAKPVLARADTIKHFKRKDCKRIRLIIEVPGVFMTDTQGKKLEARVTTELNLCADGQPPNSEEQ